MNLQSKLSSWFNVQPGEGRLVSLLLLNYFLLGAAFNFTQTAAFALFLVEFDAQTLPFVYIANAVVVSLITFAYLKLGEHLSFSKLLVFNLGFLLLLISAFRLGLALTGAGWLVFSLPILFQVLVNFGNIEFWTLAGRVLNVRQGKRLFGLVGAGMWVAIVITGFLMPPLVALFGTANLLLLAAGAVMGALVLLLSITRTFADHLSAPAPSRSTQARSSSADLLKSRYVILMFALVIIAWVGFFFLDNLFYGRAAAQYPDEVQLASFLGIFLAILGIVTLFSNTFLAGRVINHYGLRVSIMVLPVILLVGVAAMAVIGSVPGVVTLLFWTTVLARLLEMALRFSIDRSAFTILYQPLPAHQRGRAQTMAEGIFQPLANGLAGLALLALNVFFPSGTVQLIYALFFIVIAWVVVAALLARGYPAMLMKALTRRRLGDAQLSLADGSSLVVLQEGLRSQHPGVVIYSLNLLEEIQHASLPAFLGELLAHPAPEVRKDALQRIERLEVSTALEAVRQRVAQEPCVDVRGTALYTLAALGEAEVFEEVSGYLEDPEPQLRRGALVGLLRSGGIEGVLAAGHKLLQMCDSAQPAERVLAAQVLQEVGVRSFHQPLTRLLGDDDLQVRRAALLAAGQLKSARLWSLVLAQLGSPKTWAAATAALVAGGQSALPAIGAALTMQGQDREMLTRLTHVCGRIGGDGAIALLKDKIDFPDQEVRTQILHALGRCGYRVSSEQETSLVERQIEAEAAQVTWTLAAWIEIGQDEATSLLREALAAKLEQSRARIFYLLSFIYDAELVLRARDNLTRASSEKKAYALEVIDILVSKELKRILLPLLGDLSPHQRLQDLSAVYPQAKLTSDQRLKEIIVAPDGQLDTWTRAVALYTVGLASAVHLQEAVVASLSAPDSLVRETSVWALARLNGALPINYIDQLRHDVDTHTAEAIRQLDAIKDGDHRALSTIERVVILKRVGIFANTPDQTLAEVAMLLEEVEQKAGQTIFRKGETGDCMYIIVDGEVRVHDGQRTLNHLGAGSVFGEMALLDSEPRVASVTTVTETRLLRLDQEPFYGLMDARIEVARGIIRVLSEHLRARVRDLNDARGRLERLEPSSEFKSA
ncbi:MAG: cyclic nucleotide-binding domain-containing protein [Anaerolineales bacterium]|nr:MAG: cyclic nucleotide-binding domain-containing protein [Anaerolineales bacterium]